MNFIHLHILFLILINCSAGPLEDIANMPDLTLFYQQLMQHQDIQMILQGIYPQQHVGVFNDFTIFAPNNDAMTLLTRKNQNLNLLWKYHIVSGRYDDQMLYNMAQRKFNLASQRQMIGIPLQNNLPTIALPFQVYYGLGFYGGPGPYINETFDNAGYGLGGISWLRHTSLNRTNPFEYDRSYLVNNNNQKQNYYNVQGSSSPNNPNIHIQSSNVPNTNYNSYFQQQNYVQIRPNADSGVSRSTINNAFILQSRPITRGIINVIDNILWLPERHDQGQHKAAYDILEDRQFSYLRQLAERSDYFRSELRSMHHQTWFLPTDQAFAGMSSSLSFLLDRTNTNNTNDINEFIKAHAIPLVLFPSTIDSTKQVMTFNQNKWITFRKETKLDQSFQIDVICGRYVARVLVSHAESIRLFGNGIVYPISAILSGPTRSAADELLRSYQYFMNLVQQSGDFELIKLLQGATDPNMYNSQNSFNITVLIPRQMSMQQLGNAPELSMNLRRHILRFPVYTEQYISLGTTSSSIAHRNLFQTGFQHQQQQPLIPLHEQPFFRGGFNQQQQFRMPHFQQSPAKVDRKDSRYRRQMNVLPNSNFQSQPFAQQPLPNQQILPIQQQQIQPIQQQQQIQPTLQQPQILQDQQYQMLPTQQQQLNPNPYPTPMYPSLAIFQNGQVYPTLDPRFFVQAQISSGAKGNIVTLVGQLVNSLPFTATILNSESNIAVKNGVMHVVQGVLSGTVMPLEVVLTSLPGTSTFTQLLQRTGIIAQLKQSGSSYTLFVPTNAALQSIDTRANINRLRHFVLRHICADVLLDPTNNILRRSAGFYKSVQNLQKRQNWISNRRNNTNKVINRQGFKLPAFNADYFQSSKRSYGDNTGNLSPLGSNNQLYNLGYPMNSHASSNSKYFPTYNTTYTDIKNFNKNTLRFSNLRTSNIPSHQTMNAHFNPQINIKPVNRQRNDAQNFYTGSGPYIAGSTYINGPQSCIALTGERITVQPLAGTRPEISTSSMSYQNFIVTCCDDQSVNSMVQSYNIYSPNLAVYRIGRVLLSQGQTINRMYSYTSKLVPSSTIFFIFIISIILQQTCHF